MKKIFLLIFIATTFNIATFAQVKKPISSNVIGDPIRLGNLEIAQHDFGKKMSWKDARNACIALGEGWRLPTREELTFIYGDNYGNPRNIGDFAKTEKYWTSTEYAGTDAWYLYFGGKTVYDGFSVKSNTYSVRAIKLYIKQ
jgi:hypothetical protein